MKKNIKIIIPMLIMLFGTILIFDFYSRVAEDQLIISTSVLEDENKKLRHEVKVNIDWKWVNYRVRNKSKNDLIIVELNSNWDWDMKHSSLPTYKDDETISRINKLGLKNPYVFQVQNEGKNGSLQLVFGEDFPLYSLGDMGLKIYYLHDSQSAFFPGQRAVNFVKELIPSVAYAKENTLDKLKQKEVDSISYFTKKERKSIVFNKELSFEIIEDLTHSTVAGETKEGLNFNRIIEVPNMEAILLDEQGRFMKFEFGQTVYTLQKPIDYKIKNLVIETGNANKIFAVGYEKERLKEVQDGEKHIALNYFGSLELSIDQNFRKVIEENIKKPSKVEIKLVDLEEQGSKEILVSYSILEENKEEEKRYSRIYGEEKESLYPMFDSDQEKGKEKFLIKEFTPEKEIVIYSPSFGIFEKIELPKELDSLEQKDIEENIQNKGLLLGDMEQIQILDGAEENKKIIWARKPIFALNNKKVGYANLFYQFKQNQYILDRILIENPKTYNRKIIALLLQENQLTASEIGKKMNLSEELVTKTLDILFSQGFVVKNQHNEEIVYSLYWK